MANTVGPVQGADRIASLDVLRGFALLGILIMNIQSFAMVEAAYLIPSQYGDLTGVNWWVWAVSHALADMKFMTLFSMLFGAGILLAIDARTAKGLPTLGHHYKRNFWLLIFGLIHAYLIWYGDILVTYALAAFMLYWLRNLRAFWLFVIGAVLLSLPLLLMMSVSLAPVELQQDFLADFIYSPEDIAAELAAYRGTWGEVLAARIPVTVDMHLFAVPFFLLWRAAGVMLLGMGLYKAGVLAGTRSPQFYARLAVAGLAVGLPLVITSVIVQYRSDFDPLYTQGGPGLAFNYIGSIAMTLGYVGLFMRLSRSNWLPNLQSRLAAVGRTAFTNYILQSVLCSLIFYGFGLGLFGHVDRWGQILIVFAIWVLQLLLAPLWLARYRFGPLEWLWRSLTYMRLQPMRRG